MVSLLTMVAFPEGLAAERRAWKSARAGIDRTPTGESGASVAPARGTRTPPCSRDGRRFCWCRCSSFLWARPEISRAVTFDVSEAAGALPASRGPADAAGRAERHTRGCDRRLECLRGARHGCLLECGPGRAAPGHEPGADRRDLRANVVRLVPSLLAISFMVGLAYVTRYSGMDTILGLSLTRTGPLFPSSARCSAGWEWP